MSDARHKSLTALTAAPRGKAGALPCAGPPDPLLPELMLAALSASAAHLVGALTALRLLAAMSKTELLQRPPPAGLHRPHGPKPPSGRRPHLGDRDDRCSRLVLGPKVLKRVGSPSSRGGSRRLAEKNAVGATGCVEEVGEGPGCCGLANAGNTCYQNSVLQCLNSVPGVVEYLRGGRGGWREGSEVTPRLAALVEEMWSRPPRSVCSAEGLRRAMAGKAWRAGPGSQEDAHEFFTALLQAMRDEGARNAAPPKYREIPDCGNPVAQAGEEWAYSKEWNDSPIDDLFGFQNSSATSCPACGAQSHRFDYATELQLEIPRGVGDLGAVSLKGCLERFRQEETLEGYSCSACGKEVAARKVAGVHRYPEVLVVTLKRFTYEWDGTSFRSGKVAAPLELEGEELDAGCLRDGLSEDRGPTRYRLLAVCNHTGGLGFGHYTAVGRNVVDGRMRHFDDSSVGPVGSLAGRCAGAYMLFFQRC